MLLPLFSSPDFALASAPALPISSSKSLKSTHASASARICAMIPTPASGSPAPAPASGFASSPVYTELGNILLICLIENS